MARVKKLKPQVELSKAGRIIVRDNRKTHYKFIEPQRGGRVKRFELRGKSVKYIKGTVIPYYKMRILNENKKTKMYKELLVNLQNKCNAIIKDIRTTERKSLRQLIVKNNREYAARVKHAALKIANEKFDSARHHNSMALHGAMAYPAMVKFAYERGLNGNQISIIIILTMYDTMYITDMVKYGYPHFAKLTREFKTLFEMGYVERTQDLTTKLYKRYIYMASVKGRRLVVAFNRFYNKYVKETIESDEFNERYKRWSDL